MVNKEQLMASGGHKAEDTSSSMEAQLLQLQQLMKMQMEISLRDTTPTMKSRDVKHVKVPEGRYDMKSAEFRMYSKYCYDFHKLTKQSDEDIVI